MQNIEGKRKLDKFMLCMKINFSFYILLMIILITETSCKKSHAPYFEIPPWGPVSGERGNYSFSAAAIDPDNDSIVIRFDWGDSTLSQWSEMIASGDTVTQTHFYGNTGLFQIRAQAMDINEEVSEWSDYHTFDCSTNLLWLRRYGGVSYDYGNDVKQTLDNGYIIIGSTSSSGAGRSDIYVVKTSADGTLEWEQTYGGRADDYGTAIEVASDNNYVIAGYTHSYGAGDADMYVLKIQPYGTVIWEKTYGGANTDYAYDLQETNDNGFIIIGLTASYGAGSGDLYAIRLNPNGDSIWAKTYGGLDIDCGNSVQQTVDGGYIAAGYTYSSGAGGMDIYVVKMDSNGDSTWTRTYGTAGTDYGSEVIPTVDGGYVV